ncbi:MAG: ATP-binding cassette domain-containing protein [Halobacteriales archaeon]
MAAIETRALTKRFGEVVAVDGLDLTVDRGEVFGFLGPNGAGKSTTINVLLDLTRPTAGTASVLGLDCQTESQAIRERVGVLPEGFDLYGRLTGRQHVKFAARAKAVTVDPEAVLARVGLDGDAADRTVDGYSKGMRQRLALAMAMVGDPEVLILDEPSSGLDPTGIEEVRQLVRAEADRGTTVFFSSHILSEVEAACDRVGVLHEGTLVATGSLDDLRSTFAGDDRLEATVGRVPDDAEARLGAIDGVSDVDVDGQTVVVHCEKPEAKARAVVALDVGGADVRDLHTHEGSLDEVFAAVTGRSAGGEPTR